MKHLPCHVFRSALIFVALASAADAGEDIYVDFDRGQDTGTGTGSVGEPLRTAQIAVDRSGPGDTIHLLPRGSVARQTIVLRGKERLTIEGHGVTLTGADPLPAEGWEDLGNDLARLRMPRTPMDRHLLVVGGRVQRMGRSPTARPEFPAPERLGPGQFAWAPIDEATGWLYVRGPREDLEWGARLNAMAIQDGNRGLVIRNLHCRHSLNDGFNVHGDSQGLRFEGISGYENFDEGFSAHETSQCHVDGGRFWGNDNATADIGESDTTYTRCEFRDSVSVEVLFQGGRHRLTDCVILAGGDKAMSVNPGIAGKENRPTPVECRLAGCDVSGHGGAPKPITASGATLHFEHCALRGVTPQIHDCSASAEASTLDGRPLRFP